MQLGKTILFNNNNVNCDLTYLKDINYEQIKQAYNTLFNDLGNTFSSYIQIAYQIQTTQIFYFASSFRIIYPNLNLRFIPVFPAS